MINLDNFEECLVGNAGFEQAYSSTIVVFEISRGVYEYWHPEPWLMRSMADPSYDTGIPSGIEIHDGYSLDELADQLGIFAAYGFDL